MYIEDEFLQLSGIQHYAFCRRQWALAYLELQWAENLRTVEGHIFHEHAHDSSVAEKRGDLIVSRAMPIHSFELGISGECDIVELHRDENGVFIPKYNDSFRVIPVEYKHGHPKENDIDALQLCGQALCLEEMLCTEIPFGYIYYGETRHRQKIEITAALREKTKKLISEMHDLSRRGITPKAKRTKSCNACSLNNICLPGLAGRQSVSDYIASAIKE